MENTLRLTIFESRCHFANKCATNYFISFQTKYVIQSHLTEFDAPFAIHFFLGIVPRILLLHSNSNKGYNELSYMGVFFKSWKYNLVVSELHWPVTKNLSSDMFFCHLSTFDQYEFKFGDRKFFSRGTFVCIHTGQGQSYCRPFLLVLL